MLVAIAGAAGLYLFLAWLLGVDARLAPPSAGQPKLPLADQQKLLADLVKIALGLAAGIGAAFALVVGYRRARVEEASSHRDDRRLFSSRYQDAADLIGSDKPAVRLAGIYAMARLADDWEEQRQQCIDVLCAYLRPYYPATDTEPAAAAAAASEPGEREVRLTVIQLIGTHLQPGATRPWHGHDFDFTGAVFDGGNFFGAEFSEGTFFFGGATFSGGTLNFGGALFSGGILIFGGALFSGGTVDFRGATFSGGTVDFRGVQLSGGTVDFARAQFSGGFVDFIDAKFSGGTVDFDRAEFSGGAVDLSETILPTDGVAPQHLPTTPTAGLKLPGWLKPPSSRAASPH